MTNAETLSAAAGLLLSLLLAYVPGLAPWFEGLQPIPKRLVLLVLLGAIAAGSFALACTPSLTTLLPPDAASCIAIGAAAALRAFLAALVANQAAYAVAVRGLAHITRATAGASEG